MRTILIIKPGAIGDVLQLTPVIRALHAEYPGTRISVLVGSAATASLFANNPHVAEAIVFNKRGSHKTLRSRLGLWLELRRRKFDLVVNFQRANLASWFLASAAIPSRVLVYHRSRRRGIHAVTNYLETLAPLGIAPADPSLEIFPGADDVRFADALLAAPGGGPSPVVALNPGASHPVNRWGPEQFAALADRITASGMARVVIVGGPGEDAALAADIAAKSGSKPLNIAGKTTILQLAALLRRCSALVTGDTGPMHVATAVGTRVVALFGAADPGRTGPVGQGHVVLQAEGLACAPCRSRRCSNALYRRCMDEITPDRVFEALRAMLAP